MTTLPDAAPAPELDLSVQVEADAWRAALPDLESRARRWVAAAVAGARADRGGAVAPLDVRDGYEMGLLFASDATVRGLNRDWRRIDRPTNVLAFAAQETAAERPPAAPAAGPLLLGDVVLCYETIAREAKVAARPLADHLSHLVIHGVLHLLGYDHGRPREARAMETLEVKALETLGIGNPYEAPPTMSRMVRARRAMER